MIIAKDSRKIMFIVTIGFDHVTCPYVYSDIHPKLIPYFLKNVIKTPTTFVCLTLCISWHIFITGSIWWIYESIRKRIVIIEFSKKYWSCMYYQIRGYQFFFFKQSFSYFIYSFGHYHLFKKRNMFDAFITNKLLTFYMRYFLY